LWGECSRIDIHEPTLINLKTLRVFKEYHHSLIDRDIISSELQTIEVLDIIQAKLLSVFELSYSIAIERLFL